LLPALVSGLAAQSGTPPKAAPEDYPVHARLEKLAIGAEYLVHSFSGRGRTFVANHYLVVEVALFPGKDERFEVNSGQFTLRVNGRKQALSPEAAEFVAAALKFPDWEARRNLEVDAGPIILGRPQPVERFPGDPQARPQPVPPKAPTTDHAGGPDPPLRPEELIVETALPQGEVIRPISGYLYFPYGGNAKRIRSLELDYANPLANVTLPLL